MSGDVVAFRYLGDCSYTLAKVVGNVTVQRMQFDRAKHDESFLEFVGIDHGDISAEEAFIIVSDVPLLGEERYTYLYNSRN